jgi:glycosyltransferase involved in cell wall biosynthesis
MRILYSYPQRIGVSGVGMIAWHQVAGFIAQGVDVHLCCGSCERPIPGLVAMQETMRLGGIRVPYRLLGDNNAFAWHDRMVARRVSRDGGFDLIHCWPLGAYRTLLAARSCGIATVLERPNSHTAFAYEVVAAEHKKIGLPLFRSNTHAHSARRLQREEAEYRLATRLACPSDFVMNTFVSRGFKSAQIMRHRYGYDNSLFVAPACENGEASGSTHPFTAAFVGRCEPRKGLHYALEAWHASGAASSGRFLIAGTFVPGYRELLARLLDHPSIELLGFVNNPHAVMQKSDVFVLPSVEEGSALVTYEARACGCVLVVSDASGANCVHEREGLVHPAGDVVALTDQLRMLHQSPKLLAQLRSASLQGIPELSWNAAARHLISLYEGILAADGTAPGGTMRSADRAAQL